MFCYSCYYKISKTHHLELKVLSLQLKHYNDQINNNNNTYTIMFDVSVTKYLKIVLVS